jgi:signal transduction histidine kinase
MSWRISDWTLYQRLVGGLVLVLLCVLVPLGSLLFWQLHAVAQTRLPSALSLQVDALLPPLNPNMVVPPILPGEMPPVPPVVASPPELLPVPNLETRLIPDWCKSATTRQQFAAQLGLDNESATQFCNPSKPFPKPVAPISKLLAVSAAQKVMSELIGSVLVSFGIASAALLFLTTWLGRRLLHQGLAPLRLIAAQTASFSSQALHTRLPVPDAQDEIRSLTIGLNEMLARLQHSFQNLETAEAQVRIFAAEASHELRTPITALRGQLELLERLQDDPKVRHKLIGNAGRETERIARLVNELLTITHLDAGANPRTQAIELPSWLEALADQARSSMVNLNVIISSPMSTLRADPELLERALWNLLSNAVRYGTPDAPLHVLVENQAAFVTLGVFNAGDAIPEAVQVRMFERFYRAAETRHRDTSGVGLGLAIVQAVARAHHGDVFVHSPFVHQGVVGSKVGLRLPRLDSV